MTLRLLGNVLEFKGYPIAVVLHGAPPSVQEEFREWLRTTKDRLIPDGPLTKPIHEWK